MANIVWSFGIALQAQDEISAPVHSVIESLNAMDKSLAALNERQISNIETVKTLTNEYRALNEAMGSGGLLSEGLNAGAEAAGGLADSLGSVATAGEYAVGAATGGIGLVVAKVVEWTTYGIYKIVSGLFSAVEFIIGKVVPTIIKIGAEAVKVAFGVVKGFVEGTIAVGKTVVNGLVALMDSPLHIAEALTDTLMHLPDTIAKWVFGKNLKELEQSFNTARDSVNNFLALGNAFGPIDKAIRQLNAEMGRTPEQANKMIATVVQMGIDTGISVQSLSDLSVALGRTGQSLNDIKPETATRMAHLAETFGLGADETVRFSSAARRIGADLVDLAGKAAGFGAKFGIPGVMKIMPELTNMAADSIARFSKNIVGDQRHIVDATLKTSAVFAKAFGKDITEAAGMAQQSFEKFAGAAQQNEDVMLGLQDQLSPLSMALLQGGANWQQMNSIIKNGKDAPIAAIGQMRALRDSMAEGSTQQQLFIRQMQQQLTPAQFELFQNTQRYVEALDAAKLAQQAQRGEVGRGAQQFDDMTKSLRSNFSTMMQVLDNVETAIKAIFGSIFTESASRSLEQVVQNFKEWGSEINKFVVQVKSSEVFKSMQASIEKIAGWLVTAGRGAGLLGDGLFSISTFTGLLTPIASGLQLLSGALTTSLVNGQFSLSKFLSTLLHGTSIFDGLKKTWREVSDIFSSSKGIMDKLGDTLRVLLNNFAKYFDSFFFGLPTKIVQSFSSGVDKEKATFAGAIMGIFDSAKEKIRSTLDQWNKDFPADLDRTFSKAGETIGRKIGEITKTVVDFVKGLFNPEQRAEVIARLKGMFTATPAEEHTITSSFLSLAGKVLSAAKEFITGFADGLLAPFGTNVDTFAEKLLLHLKDTWLSMQEAFYNMKNMIYTIWGELAPVFKSIGDTVLGVADTMMSAYEDYLVLRHPIDTATGAEYKELDDLQAKMGQLQASRAALKNSTFDNVKAQQDATKATLDSLKADRDKLEAQKTLNENKQKGIEWALKEAEAIKGGTLSAETAKLVTNNWLTMTKANEDMKKSMLDILTKAENEFASTKAEAEAQKLAKQYNNWAGRMIVFAQAHNNSLVAEERKKWARILEIQTEANKDAENLRTEAAEKEKKEQAETNASGPSEATPADDVRSEYQKALAIGGKQYADLWLQHWADDGLAKDKEPGLPKVATPVSTATPAEKPAVSSTPAAASNAMTIPSIFGGDLIQRAFDSMQESMSKMANKDPEKPVDVKVIIEGIEVPIQNAVNKMFHATWGK